MTGFSGPDAAPSRPERSATLEAGSFRDPSSRVFYSDGGVYRALSERALADWNRLMSTSFFPRRMEEGSIIGSELVDDVDLPPGDWAGVLRHDPVPFISYPYEWTFSMLKDAALLQLDLLADALAEDVILKDSTPYNMQWRGTRPVFIDIGSFETLEQGDVWVGYRQFLRMYVYPLMLRAYKGVPFQPWMQGAMEGITAGEMRDLLSGSDLFKKGVPLHLSLQARAERKHVESSRDVRSEMKEAGFKKEMIEANVRGLRNVVNKLDWDPSDSTWNKYAAECDHVSLQRDAKTVFLRKVLEIETPSLVWDVGANDGHFSIVAAEKADLAVAMDGDEVVLEALYRSRRGSDGNVQILLQDFAAPSPGLGWRGKERSSLEDRARPDLVMCFAVIHHLVIGRNIPLADVMSWLHDLGGRVILEFVSPEDPMVQVLTANKRPHEIHADYSEDSFRALIEGRFEIEMEEPLPGETRRLFSLRPVS